MAGGVHQHCLVEATRHACGFPGPCVAGGCPCNSSVPTQSVKLTQSLSNPHLTSYINVEGRFAAIFRHRDPMVARNSAHEKRGQLFGANRVRKRTPQKSATVREPISMSQEALAMGRTLSRPAMFQIDTPTIGSEIAAICGNPGCPYNRKQAGRAATVRAAIQSAASFATQSSPNGGL